MNMRSLSKTIGFFALSALGGLSVVIAVPIHSPNSSFMTDEIVQACVITRDMELTDAIRARIAQCLGANEQYASTCLSAYKPIAITLPTNPDEVHIMADRVSLYSDKRSVLVGDVEVQQGQRVVTAQTAYVYRDAKTKQLDRIDLLGEVHYLEPEQLMIAKKASFNPQNKSGYTFDVLYRFKSENNKNALPAWGRARFIKRFANKDYLLQQATYTTCAPQDKAWDVQAKSIAIDQEKAIGVARHATVRLHDWPIFYTPYLSFPTNKTRKSGFLLPVVGYSNVGGFDFGVPYYWNMAPNYDMTVTPHWYAKRGVMFGEEFRYLTPRSSGLLRGSFLSNDRAYKNFLTTNQNDFPQLIGNSANRWSVGMIETSTLSQNLFFHVNAEQVSDDYYLQDFSSNLAQMTQKQLLREADLVYSSDHWLLRGMVESYQTLHPINEPPISAVYARLPQLLARGDYYDLPFNARFNVLGQYDQFSWPADLWNAPPMPYGPRFHVNPVLSMPMIKPWGYLTPSVQLVENYYQIDNPGLISNANYNRTIPRYSLDGGLYFERSLHFFGNDLTQALEPRLFYLRVPFQKQTVIPVFDSGYMIFNTDQLFRTNRFSGFDRIGDANQLTYAVTTRWLLEETGVEKATVTVGQIKYFADRNVQLCQSATGYCVTNPYTVGYLSPTYGFSPIASRATYRFNSNWGVVGDYIWDPATKATNNADLNLHYQPIKDVIIHLGYSYLINADVTQARDNLTNNNALHQALFAYTWPLSEKWSTIGAYSQNISKHYSMMSLLGLQYDSCCWAMRLMGGHTFKNLNASYQPQYNNNIYLQILLKGLGTIATSDPSGVLNTYIPGYPDPFRR